MTKTTSKTCTLRQADVSAVSLYNLRAGGEGIRGFVPVGNPEHVAAEGWEPMMATDAGGAMVAGPDGIGRIKSGGGVELLHNWPGDTYCMMAGSSGTLAMTENGPLADGVAMPSWNPVAILASECGKMAMTVDAVELTADYGPGAITASADRQAIQHAVEQGYGRLVADARNSGVFIQPMLARAVVRDFNGGVLYRGPQVLVSLPGKPFPLEEGVTLGMDTRMRTAITAIEVPVYRLRVVTHPMALQQWVEKAASLHIEVSPQIHPYSGSGVCHGNVTVVRSGTSDFKIKADLPGAENGLSRAWPVRSNSLLRQLMERFESMSTTIRTFPYPYLRGVEAEVDGATTQSLDTEVGIIRHALKDTDGEKTVRPELAQFRAPHGFVARLGVRGARHTLWADVTPVRYGGYSPLDFATDTEPGKAWTARTSVIMADGSHTVRMSRGSSNMPLCLGAVCTYPDARATRLDMTVECDDDARPPMHWTINLEPSQDGTCAIAVDLDGFLPEESHAHAITDVVEKPVYGERVREAVLTAPADNPLEPTALSLLGDPVRALAVASSSAGAWDYGRSRFIAFTGTKTVLVNVAASGNTAATGVIAHAGVCNLSSVTTDDTGKVYFINGDTLFRIDGSKVKVMTSLAWAADRVAYDAAGRYLVCGDSSGARELVYIDVDNGKEAFRSASIGPSNNWLTAGSHVYAATQDGLLDIGIDARSRCSGNCRVGLTATTGYIPGLRPLVAVVWNLEGREIDGEVSVSRSYLSGRRAQLSVLRLSGSVYAPVQHALYLRPAARNFLEMNLKVSMDTVINIPQALYK